MANSNLRRGDIVAVNIPGFTKTHPGVVLSAQYSIEHSNRATVAVGTHNIDKSKRDYTVLVPDAVKYGLEYPTVFAGDQVFTVDQENMVPCGTLMNTEYWHEIIAAFGYAMGMGDTQDSKSAWMAACEKNRQHTKPAPAPQPAAQERAQENTTPPPKAVTPGGMVPARFAKFSSFKGRVLVYCPECKKRFHFFAKDPVTHRDCNCGGDILLEPKTMHLFDYECPACFDKSYGWTNCPDENYMDRCRCGRPIYFYFDKKENRYYGG